MVGWCSMVGVGLGLVGLAWWKVGEWWTAGGRLVGD